MTQTGEMGGRRMGFSHHPGPLPFTTIRRQQWANRTWIGDLIQIHGELGCDLEPQLCKVVAIHDYKQPAPAHLAAVYAGQQLCAIELEAVDC